MNTDPESFEELKRRIRPDQTGFIVMLSPRRLGALAFIVFLEYRHFPPTPVNDEFQFALMNWEGMRLGLVLIPTAKRGLADAIMSELGLRAANGVPHVISSTGSVHFPIDLPNVFTIENIAGHFVYKNDPVLHKSAFDFEGEACEREFQKFERSQAGVEARR